MRILVLNYEYPPIGGGGGVITRDIFQELAKKHQIDIITSAYQDFPLEETQKRVQIHRVSVIGRDKKSTASILSMLSFYPAAMRKGKELIKKNKYDLVYSFFAIPSGIVGKRLARRAGVPHVLNIVGGDIYDPSKRLSPHRTFILKMLVTRVVNTADRVLAISSDIKKRALEHYDIKKKIEVVLLGIVKPVFQKNSRSKLRLGEKDFVISCIGRIVKRKGLEYLIQAIAELKKENAKLVIMGSGPELENLKKLSKKLGVEKQVMFTGFVNDAKKYQYLSASDIFALASLHEGFGIIYVEAMECGLPVIASNVGGQLDFLQDGKTGFLVPVGDSKKLTESIRKLYSSKKLRDRIGKYNTQHVKKFYIDKVAAKYGRVFKEVKNE